MSGPSGEQLQAGDPPSPHDPLFLRACRGRPVEHVPVWFMRQAGRSLPEYRALRGAGSILDAIHDPALSADLSARGLRRAREFSWERAATRIREIYLDVGRR